MIILVVLSAILASSLASILEVYPYHGVTVGITPYSHPVQSIYHAQDNIGQYVYGYATPTSTKTESKTADGVTRGGYSYIDSNGILQSVQYTADALHGFQVAATNLPQDLPDVAHAKAQHLAIVEATKAENAHAAAQHLAHYSNPIAVPYNEVPLLAPAPVQDLPEVIQARAEHLAAIEAIRNRDAAIAVQHAAIASQLASNSVQLSPGASHDFVVPIRAEATLTASYAPQIVHGPQSTQYQAQDAHGQYSYGYADPLSAKSETKTADGITRGGYSYIDANGVLQTVHYISDPVNGFRVAASNLPIDHGHAIASPAQSAPVLAAKPSALYSHNVYY